MQSTHEIRQKPTLPGDSRAINISITTAFRGITTESASADPGGAPAFDSWGFPGPAGAALNGPAVSARSESSNRAEAAAFALGAEVDSASLEAGHAAPPNQEQVGGGRHV